MWVRQYVEFIQGGGIVCSSVRNTVQLYLPPAIETKIQVYRYMVMVGYIYLTVWQVTQRFLTSSVSASGDTHSDFRTTILRAGFQNQGSWLEGVRLTAPKLGPVYQYCILCQCVFFPVSSFSVLSSSILRNSPKPIRAKYEEYLPKELDVTSASEFFEFHNSVRCLRWSIYFQSINTFLNW